MYSYKEAEWAAQTPEMNGRPTIGQYRIRLRAFCKPRPKGRRCKSRGFYLFTKMNTNPSTETNYF